MFQLFQPIGGVRAMVSPTTILKERFVSPRRFFAWSVSTYSPGFAMEPEILPVLESTAIPSGRFSAENVIGRLPVAGMVNKRGCSGRTPNTLGPLIFGAGPGLGVRMYFDNVSWAWDTTVAKHNAARQQRFRKEDKIMIRLFFQFKTKVTSQ